MKRLGSKFILLQENLLDLLSECLEGGVAVLSSGLGRAPGGERLIFDRGGWLGLGLLQPLGDVMWCAQSEVLAELTQRRERVRLVTLTGGWLGEHRAHREPGHRHRGHRREVGGVRLVGGGDVELGRLEVELMWVWRGSPRGRVAVGGVHRGDILRGAGVRPRPRDLQRRR